MVSQEVPIVNILPQVKDYIGRWFSRRSLGNKEDKRLRHLISTAYEDGGIIHAIACCGVHLKDPVAADLLGPWDPEDHLDCVCLECLKWYRDMKPKPRKVGEEKSKR
jgi:hypothetical protein